MTEPSAAADDSAPEEASASADPSTSDPAPEAVSEPVADTVDLDLPAREPTGDDAVDAALDQVDQAGGSGLQEHLEAAESAQEALQQRLADSGE